MNKQFLPGSVFGSIGKLVGGDRKAGDAPGIGQLGCIATLLALMAGLLTLCMGG